MYEERDCNVVALPADGLGRSETHGSCRIHNSLSEMSVDRYIWPEDCRGSDWRPKHELVLGRELDR